MRINKFIAQATGMARRAADTAIADGRVLVNDRLPSVGYDVRRDDIVTLDGKATAITTEELTIMLNKPAGYVVSRTGQGSKTIYDLLPSKHHNLKPVGRLDKDSSGLLVLTNDGELANELTHPRYAKIKVYEIELDNPLQPLHQQMISDHGVQLDDGISQLHLEKMNSNNQWQVTMREGRNRQIRRTFAALGYTVTKLHRTRFGYFELGSLGLGEFTQPRFEKE